VEGFGLPVVEALLAGCRVVCSDIAAFREVGMEGCHFVPLGPGELDAFTTAIRLALCTPRILPMSMPWLSASAIAEKYIILYRYLQTRLANQDYGAIRISHIGSQDGL
jgi:glycosyltransferase involved in cell wall biosynthesis